MTKPVTGVALMILLEEGKIRLDDPVQKFIPEFKKTKVFKGMDDSGMLTESLSKTNYYKRFSNAYFRT